ncbi:MAG: DUF393 domain-containing protein [Pyrinomonadaceae bacterium]
MPVDGTLIRCNVVLYRRTQERARRISRLPGVWQLVTNKTKYAIEAYTDGSCPLCRWVRARVDWLDRDGRILWLDYHDPLVRAERGVPFTPVEMGDEMYVRRLSDHGWAKGFDAWLEILRVLPMFWKFVGRVLRLRPLSALGPYVYRWVAAHRYTLFGVPPPCDASGVCSLSHEAR